MNLGVSSQFAPNIGETEVLNRSKVSLGHLVAVCNTSEMSKLCKQAFHLAYSVL